MAHIDLRALVRAKFEDAKAEHRAATLETTLLYLDADEAEERGAHLDADLTRRVADDMQVEANRRWYTN